MGDEEDDGSRIEKLREMMNMKMDVVVAQIRKLSELRNEGLLTEEEFAAKKKDLLAQL
ncbi:MAG TPA: SHOCT domain-containing protein [Sphingomicrobium sp.]|nr:SHOCT domain-containing protein [Sphingomicrobium sp.]